VKDLRQEIARLSAQPPVPRGHSRPTPGVGR
jgi:hypothetical protein